MVCSAISAIFLRELCGEKLFPLVVGASAQKRKTLTAENAEIRRRERRENGKGLGVEVRNRVNHAGLLFFRELGKHWQSEHFFSGPFGFGEISLFVTQVGEDRLQV